ncbi:looped-hinge helix DNA binding domain, AbrB family [Caldisphaera lagunensis DSM 15908]|uniref:Looped-hinge helix DNA binding domain, AbrB family n=1 Tax=Caldisphaera lagunensis (strain DSM 15908 / JCM 11604 / ANMR 0165 / IC-154) TaxID=1056495 RepID=L0A9Y5_CALLD|nr:AbrB/MazE/SpoVT family DNA-binding domain-containing protein [Caldisphaera lagunensis]AFZ69865.1 looped-hinge helix DNA binding domain, AbrB family [Caldisphaera lagunensis DSM 15908]
MVQLSYTEGEPSLTLKLRIGRKGYIILPKAVREAVGIDEGDEVIVEINDGIVIKPAKKPVDKNTLKEAMRRHIEKLAEVPDHKEPRPGDMEGISLEEEFEE